jgi:hypothetical protein
MADLPDSPDGPGSAEPLRPPAGLPVLRRRQDALQAEAQAVIRELGLRERLGRLGPVRADRELQVRTDGLAGPGRRDALPGPGRGGGARRDASGAGASRRSGGDVHAAAWVAEPVRRARRPALVLRPALRGGGRRAVEGRRLAVATRRCSARAVLRPRHARPRQGPSFGRSATVRRSARSRSSRACAWTQDRKRRLGWARASSDTA